MLAKSLSLPFTLLQRLAALFTARGGEDELMRMSDRELADLGIGRSEIPHLVSQAVMPGLARDPWMPGQARHDKHLPGQARHDKGLAAMPGKARQDVLPQLTSP